jgi:hypothetical protein
LAESWLKKYGAPKLEEHLITWNGSYQTERVDLAMRTTGSSHPCRLLEVGVAAFKEVYSYCRRNSKPVWEKGSGTFPKLL